MTESIFTSQTAENGGLDIYSLGRQASALAQGRDPSQEEALVVIEGFQRADFDTDAPYMYVLTAHGGDELRYMRLVSALETQAKAVKYPVSAAKKQLKLITAQHPDLIPKPNIASPVVGGGAGFSGLERFFGNQPVAYGPYTCDDSGVHTTTPQGAPVTVIGHPILITRRSEDVTDKDTPDEALDITWWMDGGWKTLPKVPRDKVMTKAVLAKLLASKGVDTDDDRAAGLMRYLAAFDSANRAIIPRVKTTRVIGWTEDGFFAPITGSVEMADFSKSDCNAIAKAIGAHGDASVWYDGVKALRAAPWSVRARIAMAGAFAAPMLAKLNLLPFWIHLEGKTGTAKTVVLRLCASIYAYTTPTGGYMRSMDTTDVGLEVLAGFVRNLPLCLNELQRIKDPKSLPKKVYMITEGTGRGRATVTLDIRESATYCTVPISTGEAPIVSDQAEGGAIGRVVAIRVKDSDALIPDAPTFCKDVLDRSWGHAAKPWIEGIKDLDFDALRAEILATMERLKQAGKAEKQAMAGAIILAADRLAEKIVFQDGVRLTEEDILPFLKSASYVDDRLRAYDTMCSIISESETSFISGGVFPSRETWGKIDGDKVTFNQAVMDAELRKRGIDPSLYVDWAIEKGVIEDGRMYGDHRHIAKKTRIGKTTAWCYIIDLSVDPTGTVPRGYTDVTGTEAVKAVETATQVTMDQCSQ